MVFSKELQEKIKVIFKNNEVMKEKLLSGDVKAIREIGSISQKGINPEDVVEAIESQDSKLLEYIHNKAKKMLELQELYRRLCLEFAEEKEKENIER